MPYAQPSSSGTPKGGCPQPGPEGQPWTAASTLRDGASIDNSSTNTRHEEDLPPSYDEVVAHMQLRNGGPARSSASGSGLQSVSTPDLRITNHASALSPSRPTSRTPEPLMPGGIGVEESERDGAVTGGSLAASLQALLAHTTRSLLAGDAPNARRLVRDRWSLTSRSTRRGLAARSDVARARMMEQRRELERSLDGIRRGWDQRVRELRTAGRRLERSVRALAV